MMLVRSKVQSGWMVDQVHSSVFGGDLGVEHSLAHITHNHWWLGVKEDEKEHINTCPSCNPHNHGYHHSHHSHTSSHCLSALALI